MLIVQIYVDDIIFGATNHFLCEEFSKLMQEKFEMSMMGELKFFLGLQIKQCNDGIFINQTKYTRDILKNFGMERVKLRKTPTITTTKLIKEENGKPVDEKRFKGMIESLLYLTASRPNILFATFQFSPGTT